MMLFAAALSIVLFRGSIARMKSIGDKGSPFRSPLACFIFFPGTPLSRTLEEDVASRAEIQSRHFYPKPSAFMVL